jgi:hypothetical protein
LPRSSIGSALSIAVYKNVSAYFGEDNSMLDSLDILSNDYCFKITFSYTAEKLGIATADQSEVIKKQNVTLARGRYTMKKDWMLQNPVTRMP